MISLWRVSQLYLLKPAWLQGFRCVGLWRLSVAGLWRLYFGQKNPLWPIYILKLNACLPIQWKLSQHEQGRIQHDEPDHVKSSGF